MMAVRFGARKYLRVLKLGGRANRRNSRTRQTYFLTTSETPKNVARRFEVLHRRNYCEGVPWTPDFAN